MSESSRPPIDCSTPGFLVHHHLMELTQTHVHFVSDSIQPSHPVIPFSSCRLSFPASGSLLVGSSHWVAEISELQHQSIQWIFRVNFLRIDWFDLLADQGTLKSLLQNHSSKAAILQFSAFFMVQLSHTHMTTGKEYLTLWVIVGKVISLLFIMLSRFVITFLPRSKCL